MAFEDHSLEDFERLSAVNFRGVFLGCKHAVVRFKEQGDGGVILNTGSVAGLVGWGGTVYGATKGAVNQLTRALAVEVAPFGSGSTPSARPECLTPTSWPRAAWRSRARRSTRWLRTPDPCTPWAGPSRPRTVRRPRCYLCSDRAANVTGVLLPIDGGYVAK